LHLEEVKRLKVSAPKKIVFIISVVAFLAGLIGTFISIPFVSGISFWLIVGSFVLLALGNTVKGL